MKYSFIGKNTVVSDALKEKTTNKMQRLEKLIPENTDIFVTYSVTKLENKVEVTIPLQKRILRAEAREDDMYAAVDHVVDILDSQLVKYKGRLKNKSRKDNAFKDEFNSMFKDMAGDDEDQGGIEINKIKRFAVKPMDPEEAAMEMDLLHHNFYVFRNTQTNEVNVVYKRNDNTFGLIEPEF